MFGAAAAALHAAVAPRRVRVRAVAEWADVSWTTGTTTGTVEVPAGLVNGCLAVWLTAGTHATITANGQAMTPAGPTVTAWYGEGRWYTLVAPPSGPVSVTFTGANSSQHRAILVVLEHVHQTAPVASYVDGAEGSGAVSRTYTPRARGLTLLGAVQTQEQPLSWTTPEARSLAFAGNVGGTSSTIAVAVTDAEVSRTTTVTGTFATNMVALGLNPALGARRIVVNFHSGTGAVVAVTANNRATGFGANDVLFADLVDEFGVATGISLAAVDDGAGWTVDAFGWDAGEDQLGREINRGGAYTFDGSGVPEHALRFTFPSNPGAVDVDVHLATQYNNQAAIRARCNGGAWRTINSTGNTLGVPLRFSGVALDGSNQLLIEYENVDPTQIGFIFNNGVVLSVPYVAGPPPVTIDEALLSGALLGAGGLLGQAVPVQTGSQFQQLVGGALFPGASLVRNPRQTVSAVLTPATAVARRTNRALTATAGPSAVVRRQALRVLAAALTPASTAGGVLGTPGVSASAALTPAGAATRQARRTVSAGAAPAAAVRRSTLARVFGAVAPASELIRAARVALGATTAPTATATRQARRPLTATVAATAELFRAMARALTATTTPAGAVTRQSRRALTATTTPAGAATARPAIRSTATTTPTATANGALGTLGVSAAAGLTPAAVVRRAVGAQLAAAIAASAGVARRPTMSVQAVLGPQGSAARRTAARIVAVLVPAATVRRTVPSVAGAVLTTVATAALIVRLRAAAILRPTARWESDPPPQGVVVTTKYAPERRAALEALRAVRDFGDIRSSVRDTLRDV